MDRRTVLGLVVVSLIALAACGGDGASPGAGSYAEAGEAGLSGNAVAGGESATGPVGGASAAGDAAAGGAVDAVAGAGGSSDAGAAGSGGEANSAPCATNVDCSGGELCDQVRGVCVGCLVDADCSPGNRCRAKVCEPRVYCKTGDDCPALEPFCSPESFQCERCVLDKDCGAGGECTAQHRCITHPTCVHASDCPAGLACDPAGRCVECFYSADCGVNRKCLAGVCADACATSASCTAPTGSCDSGFGACVRCLNDTQCPTSHYCNYGRCELKTCTKGEQFCSGADVLSCQADGHSLISARTCLTNYTCQIDGSGADCVSNVSATLCTAGDTKCDGDTQLTCAADGMSWGSPVDCSIGGVCWQKKCLSAECYPDSFACQDNAVFQCTHDGADLNLLKQCGNQQKCQLEPPDCVPL